MNKIDVIVIGAGAAGLFCAIEAGKRQRRVLVIDHANKVGKKILMSGGGRCNFTNLHISPEKYISHNPHFCISALSRYTQWDFIALVEKYKIPYHEKAHGQLFCDNKSSDIVNMLLEECQLHNVEIKIKTEVNSIQEADGFTLETSAGKYHCESLVIATGGLSIPTMGASPFGYHIAEQFNISVHPTKSALVPFTLHVEDKARFTPLSGVSVASRVSVNGMSFKENILFTHRGLSGPAILQISSYWQSGDVVEIDLIPETAIEELLATPEFHNKTVKTVLSYHIAKQLVTELLPEALTQLAIKSLVPKQIQLLREIFHHFKIKPNGTEGYRTAEVTLGGVDCNALSSKTMAVKDVPGLYFIGEVLDVTGWLGGYNFQWAWSSAWAAGQVV